MSIHTVVLAPWAAKPNKVKQYLVPAYKGRLSLSFQSNGCILSRPVYSHVYNRTTMNSDVENVFGFKVVHG